MNSLFKRLLNVKGMVVEDVRIVDGPMRPEPVLEVRVRPRAGMLRCSRCGRRRRGYDRGGGVRRWRHQDFGCWRVELVASMPRVDCPKCGVVVAQVPWAEPGSRFTRDFEAECAWLMTVANQKTVSGFLHVAWRTAGDIAHRVAGRLKAAAPSPFDHLTSIGVDETSYRKGHTYITVVVDHERRRVIWAHDGYGRDVFDLFFRQLTPGQRASIRVVTGDGARWIDSCVGEFCPQAERILDGFHIVSWATDALDKVRTMVWREARRTGEARKGAKDPIKGARWALLKNESDLTAGQKARLEYIAGTNGTLWRAYKLKEELRMILRQPADEARVLLLRWSGKAASSGIDPFTGLGEKIGRRCEDIVRTIRSGLSNARLEAVNNKIKTTIKIGYGYRSLDNLISLVILKCGELNLQLPVRQ